MLELSTDIAFTDEQAMLLDAANDFCRDKSGFADVRRQLLTEDGFDRGVWREMVDLGWSGIAIPEALGGSGLTLAEVATIAEPMGRHLLATPFASTQLFVQALLAGGSPSQCAQWLPAVASGAIATTGVLEGEGDWALDHLTARARTDGDALQLSGTKTLVCDAAVADLLMVSVARDGAPALIVLQRDDLAPGSVQRETVIDETRRAYRVVLDGLCVPAGRAITGLQAEAGLQALRRTALLLASAEACGGIAGALDVIVEYLNTRVTFGRRIGSYQSLKHTAAEILVGLERSRSHLYHAATQIAAGAPAEVALRMAKVESGEDFVFAGDRAVQFHGGFGFTYECHAQLYLRRALWLQAVYGDAAHHRARLAELLLD